MRIRTVIGIVLVLAAGASLPTSAQRGASVVSLGKDVTLEFVAIAPGQFTMGCSRADSQCADDEKPAHVVKITRAFEIGKYEVTSAQWQAVMVSNPVVFSGAGDDRAAGFVSWDSAQDFVKRLNARNDGYLYRLPTEAEWEYAARSGSTGLYDGVSIQDLAWFGQNVFGRPEPVGKKRPNSWGLHDMHGNVWEWTQDYYDSRYYASSPSDDPTGPRTGTNRVLRGGSSMSDVRRLRASARHSVVSPTGNDYFGLRVVRVPARP